MQTQETVTNVLRRHSQLCMVFPLKPRSAKPWCDTKAEATSPFRRWRRELCCLADRGEDSEGERMVFGSEARQRRIGFFIHWLLNDSHLSLSLVVRRVEIISVSKCNRMISPLCFKDLLSSSGWRKKLFFGICEVFQLSGLSLERITAFLIKNKWLVKVNPPSLPLLMPLMCRYSHLLACRSAVATLPSF